MEQRLLPVKAHQRQFCNYLIYAAEDRKKAEEQALLFAKQGYRVLGVGKGKWNSKAYPATQQEFTFQFLGLIAFNDPPKPHIAATMETFKQAGIEVKIITGDYAETTIAIAKQIGLNGSHPYLTGKEVMQLFT